MKTRSETFQIGKKLPWEPAGEGVRRQIMGYDGQLMIVKVEFKKGAVGYLHEHYHSQATYVVSGKFELTIGKKDEIHGCTCLEDGILIDVFSPHRADFLKK